MTQLLSNSLVIPLVSITPGPGGKENSKWEEGRREMRDGRGGEVKEERERGKGKKRGGERVKERGRGGEGWKRR